MSDIDLKNKPLSKSEFTVIDFETTGTSARSCKVIEIGMVKVKGSKITDTYQSFVNPGRWIPSFITQLTGITNDDVEGAPQFSELAEDISHFIGNSILTAHNMPFDHSFLRSEFISSGWEAPSNNTLCTLKLSRKLFPDLPSKSLGSMVKHFRIIHKGVHRALGDATATAKILIKFLSILEEEHHIATSDELLRFQSLPSGKGKMMVIKKKLAEDYLDAPDSPGVYFFKNRNDEIIYIGKAKSLKKRVKNYFSSTAAKKAKQIVRAASRLSYKKTNSELTALLAEAQLIKLNDPIFNSQLKKYSQSYFIKINSKQKFPALKVTTKFDFDGNEYFGPFNRRETANEIKEIADYSFKMRECTEKEFKKKKVCYLADIKRCLAPCVDDSIYSKYDHEIKKAAEFFTGENQDALARLLKRMKFYSDKQKYEEAAKIRDKVNLLLSHLKKSSILSEPVNSTNALIVISEADKRDYLIIVDGKVIVKNDPLEKKDLFDQFLDDYFESAILNISNLGDKDHEKLKISLSWLAKNRTKVNIYYLKNYNSKTELFNAMSN